MSIKWILILLAIFSIRELRAARKAKRFKAVFFRTINTNFNPKYVNNFYANISKNHQSFTMVMEVSQESPVDFWMQVGITYIDTATGKTRNIFAYNLNVCNVLGKELNKFSIVHLWMANTLKYSNMPRTCPWKPGKYYWRDLRAEKESIPDFILSGKYRMENKFYFRDLNNALFTNFSMTFEIKK